MGIWDQSHHALRHGQLPDSRCLFQGLPGPPGEDGHQGKDGPKVRSHTSDSSRMSPGMNELINELNEFYPPFINRLPQHIKHLMFLS